MLKLFIAFLATLAVAGKLQADHLDALQCGTIDRIEGGPNGGPYWAVVEQVDPISGEISFQDVEPDLAWREGERVCWR